MSTMAREEWIALADELLGGAQELLEDFRGDRDNNIVRTLHHAARFLREHAPTEQSRQAAHDYIWARETVLHDSPEPEGMESTPEQRKEWAAEAERLLWETMEGPYSVIAVLLRDIDRLLAALRQPAADEAWINWMSILDRLADKISVNMASANDVDALRRGVEFLRNNGPRSRQPSAERDAARAERDRHMAQGRELEEGLRTLIVERDALKAEVARLRPTIEEIARQHTYDECDEDEQENGDVIGAYDHAIRRARTALSERQEART